MEAGLIRPVLDGLAEVRETARPAAITRIAFWRDAYRAAGGVRESGL